MRVPYPPFYFPSYMGIHDGRGHPRQVDSLFHFFQRGKEPTCKLLAGSKKYLFLKKKKKKEKEESPPKKEKERKGGRGECVVMSQAAIRSGWSVCVPPASSLSLFFFLRECLTADGSPARLLSSPLCSAELSCAAETPLHQVLLPRALARALPPAGVA